ncbi:MAG TPA: PEP-CTERM sorting domain-containing protein [Bryobacteraceae bacterium]
MTSPTFPSTLPSNLYITTVAFSATANTSSGGAGSGSEIFCVGSSACTGGLTGNQIDLKFSFTNSNVITYTCTVASASAGATCGAASSASPITVTFNSLIQTLNMTNQYNVKDTTASAALTNFSFVFGEEQATPEPSALILLGTGLMGIFALRYFPQIRNRFQMSFTSSMVGSVIASQATAETSEGIAQGRRQSALATAWSSFRKPRESSSE